MNICGTENRKEENYLLQFFDVFHAIQNDFLVRLLHFTGQNEFVQDSVHLVEVKNDIQLHRKYNMTRL